MATLTVTDLSDDANDTGSLRYDIAHAAQGDTINFDPSLAGQTVTLSSGLTIGTAVTIDGGSNNITISGNHQYTDFDVTASGTTTIENLAINDGNGMGNSTPLPADQDGGNAAGGVHVGSVATLNLVHDSFSNNTATGGHGSPAGQSPFGEKGAGNGGNAAGAVYVENGATVQASDLTFSNDTAAPGQGGAADPANPAGSAGTAYPISNSTVVTNAAVCFTTGTLIRVVRNGTEADIAVEDLVVGDLAVTASGTRRPILWIGQRDLDAFGRPLHHDQQPIRVRAGAFGPDLPNRDLRLSPGHPVLVGADVDHEGGHLVPIMCLVNGTSVAREPATTVTYWHVELDRHDILLAEGLPAESYLDWGDRAFFTKGSDHALHNPDFIVPGLAGRCRPVAVEGPVVEAERRRLDTLFAGELAGHAAWGEADTFAWHAT